LLADGRLSSYSLRSGYCSSSSLVVAEVVAVLVVVVDLKRKKKYGPINF